MHTIYVGDKPIILTSELNKESNFKSFLLKTVNIGKVIKTLNSTSLDGVYLVHNNPEILLKQFLKG